MNTSEALQDIEKLENFAENSEKKEIAAKYGINSRKAKEILDGIVLQAKQFRLTKHVFDESDIKLFRKQEIFGSYKKLEAGLLDESLEFIKYAISYYEEQFKQDNLYSYISTPARILKSRLSYGKVYRIEIYQWLVKYYAEHSPEGIEKQEAKDAMVSIVSSKFDEQLKDFKERLLKQVEEQSTKEWNSYPEKLEKYTKLMNAANKKIYDFKHSNLTYRVMIANSEYKECEKAYQENSRRISIIKMTMKKFSNLTNFVKYCVEQADKEFEMKKIEMSKKLIEKKINPACMQIIGVREDPKFIEMTVDDGEKKLYCRSIIAAQYSEKVTVHLRFIITDRSGK